MEATENREIATPRAASLKTEHPLEFSGQTGEFFGIWIVNILLSILTLGIYSAWAKVRTKQYFYGNTQLDGSAFEYTADPVRILKGRVLAVIALVAYSLVGEVWPNLSGIAFLVLMALLPAVIVMSQSFRMRNTRWRGIRFAFERDYLNAYRLFTPAILYVAVIVAIPFVVGLDFEVLGNAESEEDFFPESLKNYFIYTGIVFVIAGLLFPWWHRSLYTYLCNRGFYGRARFSGHFLTKSFYGLYLKAFLILVVAGLAVTLPTILLVSGGTLFAGAMDGGSKASWAVLLAFIPMLFLMVPYGLAFAYIQAQRTNLIYGNLRLPELNITAELETLKIFGLYFTNTLAILLTLGLAVPWARIRTARYKLSRMHVLVSDFDHLTAGGSSDQNALGEEVGEFFGLDLGL